MYILMKHSTPRWFKAFETISELTEELSLNTCKECHDSYGSDLDGMRYSDCGLEFTIEGVDMDEPMTIAEHLQEESEANCGKQNYQYCVLRH